MNAFLSLLIIFSLTPKISLADREKPKLISQKNSKCSIKRDGGEYPSYRVLKGRKTIFEPKSDGIVSALISPSGKYMVLSAGEVSLIDIDPEKFEYGVVIINCENGKIKGYRKGSPTLITKWADISGESLP